MHSNRPLHKKRKDHCPENTIQEMEWLCKFRSGDEDAFRKIFDAYHHRLYRYVIRFVKSGDLASDIVQDVFIKIWEKRDNLKLEYSFKAFLYTIARNHLLNVLRRAANEALLKEEILSHALHAHNQCEEEVVLSDFTHFAELAIESLPPQRKLVFKMFKDEDMDYHQISMTLGISKNTVRDHLAKATKFVKQYLRVHTGIVSLWLAMIFFNK